MLEELFLPEYFTWAGARPKRADLLFIDRMKNFSKFTPKNLLLAISLTIFPWLPPVLFEKTDFYFHLAHQPDWYYNLSGNRLLVDLASFAVWE